MGLRMNKVSGYELTSEERENLRNEIIELLEEYDYSPTSYGVDKIINEWIRNKGWMINLFKHHTNYNGRFQIVFDNDYQRVCNRDALNHFASYIYEAAKRVLVEKQLGVFSYSEVKGAYKKLSDIAYAVESISSNYVLVNGMTPKEINKEKGRWLKKLQEYEYSDDIVLVGRKTYTKDSYDYYTSLQKFADKISIYTEPIANEDFAVYVNKYFPEVKAVAGQKVSRIVGKIGRMTGLDKDEVWNREFAKYSDAINPLTIKRHTILSCHPVDYLTMSFGNSWASCHTIDKSNKRGMPNDYSGCFSSGTLSYMLDGSSFVFYTVDKEYNGNEYELQDKINRNMFHMGEDKLIQARVYPQSTDGETGIYKQIREIAQKVIADCLGVPNMWKNVRGIEECHSRTYSYGTHYKDYTNFSDCNVSYLKDETEDVNTNKINVGHDPICPHCGDTHTYAESIECESCYNGEESCYQCGDYHDTEDMHYIDGYWYCEDCCFYCEYHEEWEVGDSDDFSYINGYGRVCNEGLESDRFVYCERCEEYYINDGAVETEDGHTYCSEYCAEKAGYVLFEGEWYDEEDIVACAHCGALCHTDDYDHELNRCDNCKDIEEREAV